MIPRRLHWSTGALRNDYASRPDMAQARTACGRWLWDEAIAVYREHVTCEHCRRWIANEEPAPLTDAEQEEAADMLGES